MRLNRGTIVLLVASVVVIVAVLVLTSNQATAPGEPTPSGDQPETTPVGPVFPGVETTTLVRFEIRDNTTGERVAMLRQPQDEDWLVEDLENQGTAEDASVVIEEATGEPVIVQSTQFETDQVRLTGALESFLDLEPQEAFESSDLAQFGLDTPAYSAYVVTEDGAVHLMHIGDQNPSGTRYYAVVNQIAPGETSPDFDPLQPSVVRSEIETSIESAVVPADLLAEATDGGSLTNELSVAEMAETLQAMSTEDPQLPALAATYSAALEATNAAAGEATAQATAPAAGDEAAEGTEMVPDLQRAEIETSLTTDEAPTEEARDATAEATSLAESTLEPVEAPRVQLSGTQTIYLIPADVADMLIAMISQPPVLVVEPTPELTAEPTVADIRDVTPEAEATPDIVPLVPDTTEVATAEADS